MSDKKRLLKLFGRNLLNAAVFLSPLVFWQQFLDAFGPAQAAVIRIFIPAAFLVFFILQYIEGRLVIKKNPAFLPVVLYIAACLLSVVFSINKSISLKYVYELFLAAAGGYLVFLLFKGREINRFLYIVMASFFISSVYGLLQAGGADPFRWSTNFAGRPMGTIGNPNFFAGQMLIPFFMALGLAVYHKRFKKINVVIAFTSAVCIAFTKVAGAYFGAAAGFALFAFFVFVKDRAFFGFSIKKSAIITAAAVLVIAVAGVLTSDGIASFIKSKEYSLKHRLIMWEASLLMAKDAPVLGKGQGTYRLHYPLYQGKLLNDPKNKDYDYVVTWMPHQQYLLILAETGIIGLGLFVFIIVVFYRGAVRCVNQGAAPGIARGMAAGMTALLAASFFNTFYNVPATTFYFFAIVFLMYGLTEDTGGAHVSGKKAALTAALVSFLALVFSLYGDSKTLAANGYLKKANSMADKKIAGPVEEYYSRVLSLEPVELCPQTDVAQYYYAAEFYRNKGELFKAEELYRKDLLVNPYCPEVNNMLGALLGQLGKTDEAFEKLELAVFAAPHYDAAYINLATAYASKAEWQKAAETLRRFIAMNGPNPEIENMLKAAEREAKAGKTNNE